MRPGSRHLLALLLLVAGSPAPATASPACDAPDELLRAEEPLPAVKQARAHGHLRLLVIGSASARGPGTSGPDAAWPARLRGLLAARYPGLDLRLEVWAGQGSTTAQQLAALTEALRQSRPDLLIWQTGTVEAVRGMEVSEMVEALDSGLDLAARNGTDVVLMDQQFSRFLRANADIEPYRAALRLVATAHAVPLLRRYDLMRSWAEADRVDVERAGRDHRVAATDQLHACLAEALLTLIEHGTR